MKHYKEDAHGITRMSTEFLEKMLKHIGEVVKVTGTKDEELEYWILFTDKEGNVITTSGFSWGYSGEGPHGLMNALHKIGWTDVTINDIAGINSESDYFTITNSNGVTTISPI
jgi:hypothetical protein